MHSTYLRQRVCLAGCHSRYCINTTKTYCKIRVSYYMCQAIVAIGVVYVIAPPTWEDLTHLALSGLVDSSNEVWHEAKSNRN